MSAEELRAYGVLDKHRQPIIDPARNKKTPEQGAATSVWCATSPQLEGFGGVYCEDCDIAVPVPGGSKELRGVRPWAMDRVICPRAVEFERKTDRYWLSKLTASQLCPRHRMMIEETTVPELVGGSPSPSLLVE